MESSSEDVLTRYAEAMNPPFNRPHIPAGHMYRFQHFVSLFGDTRRVISASVLAYALLRVEIFESLIRVHLTKAPTFAEQRPVFKTYLESLVSVFESDLNLEDPAMPQAVQQKKDAIVAETLADRTEAKRLVALVTVPRLARPLFGGVHLVCHHFKRAKVDTIGTMLDYHITNANAQVADIINSLVGPFPDIE